MTIKNFKEQKFWFPSIHFFKLFLFLLPTSLYHAIFSKKYTQKSAERKHVINVILILLTLKVFLMSKISLLINIL